MSEAQNAPPSGSGQLPNTVAPEEGVQAPSVPQHIGRYRVQRLQGKGGFGKVYLAHDDELDRPVAVKVPHPQRASCPRYAASYLAEARILASLDHANIVPVYDVGQTPDGLPYIVSKFIHGCDLAYQMRQARLAFAEAAVLIATVAEALHYAHRQGLVHRDVKPGNILIDDSGKPYVADFGLALREGDYGRGPLEIAGTPAYMSPEQARGEGHRVDGRSDLFSLGVVLYELLTGRCPFQGIDKAEVLARVKSMEARPLRQVHDSVPRELERICLKALAKRATDRYPSGLDMAEDLRHFLAVAAPADQSKAPPAVPRDDAVTPTPDRHPPTPTAPLKIVPKGLRSFDAGDADFFLELLPGPRDRDGLPESLRFWKARIEESDPDKTFSVGLIYGPSGCGKSSLVKAGLLPRLQPEVVAVYIEATAEDTEPRLLKGLRKLCPGLPADAGLVESLAALRRGPSVPADRKVLLVLDQFEQWLHARKDEENTELVEALRQCDGGRVQCIVLVRDDFWLAVSRFMRDLETDLIPGRNIALVDLFDADHAAKVLSAFGRAFGKLPERRDEVTREQRAFLSQAISGLSRENKVVCVRLALFAEMTKGKPWSPAALAQGGGARGVGVRFLEDTFCSATANPRHRLHQKAARAVLKVMLPEFDTLIKGHMRSHAELLAASGYAGRARDFDDLLAVLDSEVRLITPTDPEGKEEDAASQLPADEKYYQLTHDYLVPSIREWLTRKQKETRRGRAELRLADRGTLWLARPEQRQLPSLTEWLTIRLLTAPRNWSDSQRQMMRAAARHHLLRVTGVATAAMVLLGIALFLRGQLAEESAAARAEGIVRRLLDANITQTPAIIDELGGSRRWADPLLEKVLTDPTAGREHQLRARLALLPVDPRHLDDLRDRLLEADHNELPILRDALAPHRADLIEGLWDMVGPVRRDPQKGLRAAVALAGYDPSSPRWEGSKRWVAEQLVAQPSLVLPRWVDGLRPIKERLVPALAGIFREQAKLPAGRAVVAEVLGDYAAEQPEILAEALAHATPDTFAILFPRLRRHSNRAVSALTAIFDQVPPDGGPSPNATASRRVNLAIALLRLGAGERLWPLLKVSPNPRGRSFAIDRFAALGCDPTVLFARLQTEPDDTIRAALWLGLGGLDDRALPITRRVELTPKVLDVYRQDGSAAVHAATGWLLGKWGVDAMAHDEERPLGSGDSNKDKSWYVNSAGHTMVRIAGPVTFMMGALPDEPAHNDVENRHEARIDHAYDIGMTEVTVGQFQRFLNYRGRHDKAPHDPKKPCPAADTPITRVSWYDAAEYCNWLSEIERIPRDQWCYEPTGNGKFVEGMKIVHQYQRKSGYRLPTEAEWEYACRGGATTSRCYGDAEDLLPRYAWYAVNAGEECMAVARLLPNAFGLFDMHGNASEWCQNHFQRDYDDANAGIAAEIVTDWVPRSVRGGHIVHYRKPIRSAKRFADRPAMLDTIGFRIARSRP